MKLNLAGDSKLRLVQCLPNAYLVGLQQATPYVYYPKPTYNTNMRRAFGKASLGISKSIIAE